MRFRSNFGRPEQDFWCLGATIPGISGIPVQNYQPRSNLQGHLAAILFVDDTDIVHMNMREDQSTEEAHYSLHESIQNWGKILMVTGGALKPPQCFYYPFGVFGSGPYTVLNTHILHYTGVSQGGNGTQN